MSEIDHRIAAAAEGIPGFSVLVVFGSRAGGTPRVDSDLDVAVLPEAGDSRARRDLQTSLAVALADLAPGGRVDVVLLDEAPELLRQRIMESGRVVLSRDPRPWRDLRVQTMREHSDREWVRDLMRDAQRRRLEGGQRSGRSGRALGSLGRVGKLPR